MPVVAVKAEKIDGCCQILHPVQRPLRLNKNLLLWEAGDHDAINLVLGPFRADRNGRLVIPHVTRTTYYFYRSTGREVYIIKWCRWWRRREDKIISVIGVCLFWSVMYRLLRGMFYFYCNQNMSIVNHSHPSCYCWPNFQCYIFQCQNF